MNATGIDHLIDQAILELVSYEQGGLIRSASGKVNVGQIGALAREHFRSLEQNFGRAGQELLEGMVNFTKEAYISLLAVDFLDANPERATKYDPKVFLDSAHKLSLEMQNAEKSAEFYEALTDNLKGSNRFIYHLVVRDLSGALEEANGQQNYSKESFSRFAIEVLKQALPYSQGHVPDKWSIFREEFGSIKSKYFPSCQKTEDGAQPTQGPITIRYITGLLHGKNGNGAGDAIREIADAYHPIGLDFSGKRDSNIARVSILTGDPLNPTRHTLELSRGQKGIAQLFSGLADNVLAHLGEMGYTGQLTDMTRRAKIAIANYL